MAEAAHRATTPTSQSVVDEVLATTTINKKAYSPTAAPTTPPPPPPPPPPLTDAQAADLAQRLEQFQSTAASGIASGNTNTSSSGGWITAPPPQPYTHHQQQYGWQTQQPNQYDQAYQHQQQWGQHNTTQVCRDHIQGRCYRTQCRFAHPQQQQGGNMQREFDPFTLHVAGVNGTIDRRYVFNLFDQFPGMLDVSQTDDRGFVFVRFGNVTSAANAMHTVNCDFSTHGLRVNQAHKRQHKQHPVHGVHMSNEGWRIIHQTGGDEYINAEHPVAQNRPTYGLIQQSDIDGALLARHNAIRGGDIDEESSIMAYLDGWYIDIRDCLDDRGGVLTTMWRISGNAYTRFHEDTRATSQY